MDLVVKLVWVAMGLAFFVFEYLIYSGFVRREKEIRRLRFGRAEGGVSGAG